MRTEDQRIAGAGSEPDPAAERDRLRRGVRYSLLVFLGVRVSLSVLALLGTALLPSEEPVGPPGWEAFPIEAGWHNLVTAWERFDALWFLRVADEGYMDGDGSAVFFPGYPLLIRGMSFLLGGRPLAAGLLVSNLAFAGALIVLYFLTSAEWGERVARRSVLYLAVFPTAFFFLAPYSESPFLLFALLAFWGARRGRWGVAGLAGAAAAATRNVGVLLALPLAIEGYQRWRADRRSFAPIVGGVAAAAMVGLAAGAYLLFWRMKAGEWLAPLTQQANWEREFVLPLESLWLGTREAFRWIGVYPGGYHLLDWLLVIPALVAAGWVAFRARASYAIYAWTSLLVPLSFVFSPRPFMSMPRFLLVTFPLIWAPAVWAERRRGVHEAVLVAFSLGLGTMTVLFSTWYYVF